MIITIDAIGLGNKYSGTAIYVSEIIREWNKQKNLKIKFLIFTSKYALKYLKLLELDSRFIFVEVPTNRYLKSIWQQTIMVWYLNKFQPSVHWGTSFILPFIKLCPMVVTIHDMTFHLLPQTHEYIKTLYFPFLIKHSVSRAKKILAVSNTTKLDLVKLFPFIQNKVLVTYLAPRYIIEDKVVQNKQANFEKHNYLLYVGAIEPRKNLNKLVEVWNNIEISDKKNIRLLLIGTKGWKCNELLEKIKDIQDINYIGPVTDQELLYFYKNAIALVYISLYEGFGLPIIEAMKSGLPVISGNRGASGEIVAKAGITVDPSNNKQIKKAILNIINYKHLRNNYIKLGLKRASDFTWSKTAHTTLNALIQSAK